MVSVYPAKSKCHKNSQNKQVLTEQQFSVWKWLFEYFFYTAYVTIGTKIDSKIPKLDWKIIP